MAGSYISILYFGDFDTFLMPYLIVLFGCVLRAGDALLGNFDLFIASLLFNPDLDIGSVFPGDAEPFPFLDLTSILESFLVIEHCESEKKLSPLL